MQKSNKVLGILVGVVSRYTSAYRYAVIPKGTTDIDVLWTVLPDGVKLYIVESSTVFIAFLEGLYIGEFYYKPSILRGCEPIYKAIPGDKLKLVGIDIDNPYHP
uniref:Uncharacterized protein n=1 Tax=Ignisphaera aggregans TaxID=334771 RepID=A0A7J3Z9A7_9CREN